MAEKTQGFLPIPSGKWYKSVGSGVAQTPKLTEIEKDTIRLIRSTPTRKPKN